LQGEEEQDKKCKGALKKTSGRSYSLERPVARHFVWLFLLQLRGHIVKY